MKKALMNASVASMLFKFNMDNIDILENLGYKVDIACNFGKENPISQEDIERFRNILAEKKLNVFETDCPRSIFAIDKMFKTYKQLKKLIDENEYDIVHTQSPIGGVVCRLAARKARKKGTKVIYTAHGFHFYKGAPLKNWIIFYPIEKFCSRLNDILITINKEDYYRAKKHFFTKKIEYIPGVGIDTSKFKIEEDSGKLKRIELGVSSDSFMLLSVGEINTNKNHKVIIKALGKLKNKDIHYFIAGQGDQQGMLEKLAKKENIEYQVHFLGYRSDINELLNAADAFCFASLREGLGLAGIEAMACGLPLITSNIHGINDYSINGITGFSCSPTSVAGFADAIRNLSKRDKKEYFENSLIAKRYDKRKVNRYMTKIYKNL